MLVNIFLIQTTFSNQKLFHEVFQEVFIHRACPWYSKSMPSCQMPNLCVFRTPEQSFKSSQLVYCPKNIIGSTGSEFGFTPSWLDHTKELANRVLES